MAPSMALRMPTLRNSIDLQCGQRVENIPRMASRISLRFRFRRGVVGVWVGCAANQGAAKLPRGGDLFRRPYVRFGDLDFIPRSRNLAFVPLQ
jgi:hypothetical protein